MRGAPTPADGGIRYNLDRENQDHAASDPAHILLDHG